MNTPPQAVRPRWRRHRPVALPVVAAAVAVAAVSPLVVLAAQAPRAGWASARRLLDRPLVATLLVHTLALTVTVTAAALVIGFAAAWLVERTDLPGKRTWTVLLAMPLAVPEFVHGYSWVSLFPQVQGFPGAVLVMTSALYPLVFLPTAAVLRRCDAATEEVAHSLGGGRWTLLWRVTLPHARPALAGGALLVALYLLGEYGAFAMLRYTTFATTIYTEYNTAFDTASASSLTLVLVALAVVIVVLYGRIERRATVAREGAAGRPAAPIRLGRGRPPAVAGLVTITSAALGVPVCALGYWLVRGSSTTLPPASILTVAATTVGYALTAAAVTTIAAVPIALNTWRHPSRWAAATERGAYLTRAVPGVAVALALVLAAIHYAPVAYQRPPLLVAGYAILFFPLALTAVRTSLAQVPHGVEDVASSLGTARLTVLARVTLPLILPGLGAAMAMVGLTASTELTATLLLRPTGTDTLATQFWTYTSDLAWGAAAPYAALMTALSVPAVLLLTRRTFSGQEGRAR